MSKPKHFHFQSMYRTSHTINLFFQTLMTEDEVEKVEFTQSFCEKFAEQIIHVKHLPHECKQYKDLLDSMKENEKAHLLSEKERLRNIPEMIG